MAVSKLESKLKFKRFFVNHISHEIRTPMNTIICGLKYLHNKLIKTNVNNDEKEYIQILNEIILSGDDAVEVLNEMLTYDKIENNSLLLDLTTFPLCIFLDRIIYPFNIQAKESDIELKVIYSEEIITLNYELCLYADRSKITQVIRNLISNSLKFTKKSNNHKRVTVYVDCTGSGSQEEDCTGGGGVLQIRVEDTGPGISQVIY